MTDDFGRQASEVAAPADPISTSLSRWNLTVCRAMPTLRNPAADQRLTAICGTLAAHGYEPRRSGEVVTLVNCPFDALARDHPAVVCGMNLALLGAVAERVGDGRVAARLDPGEERCCVVLDAG